jgi:hypothetical protein
VLEEGAQLGQPRPVGAGHAGLVLLGDAVECRADGLLVHGDSPSQPGHLLRGLEHPGQAQQLLTSGNELKG